MLAPPLPPPRGRARRARVPPARAGAAAALAARPTAAAAAVLAPPGLRASAARGPGPSAQPGRAPQRRRGRSGRSQTRSRPRPYDTAWRKAPVAAPRRSLERQAAVCALDLALVRVAADAQRPVGVLQQHARDHLGPAAAQGARGEGGLGDWGGRRRGRAAPRIGRARNRAGGGTAAGAPRGPARDLLCFGFDQRGHRARSVSSPLCEAA